MAIGIETQSEILGQLSQLMYDSVSEPYNELRCVFDFFMSNDDNSWSVGSQFSLVTRKGTESRLLSDPRHEATELVFRLHELMKDHTGGDWSEVTITLGSDGKAKANFRYSSDDVQTVS